MDRLTQGIKDIKDAIVDIMVPSPEVVKDASPLKPKEEEEIKSMPPQAEVEDIRMMPS
jgi:hypothetical protein